MARGGSKAGLRERVGLAAFLLLACASPARANHELIFLSGMEGCALAFPDVDGDTFGNELRATDLCTPPVSYIAQGDDCNDLDPAIKPGVPDAPDALFRDNNCDGIDGDIARAAFVAPTGANAGSCGIKTPCATIGFALAKVATEPARDHVYVRAGQYAEQLVLAAGEAVFGGYDPHWKRASRTVAGHAVTIQNGVLASGIVAPPAGGPMLENLFVTGANQSDEGASSIAVRISGSSGIQLARVGIAGGQGGPGTARGDEVAQPKAGTGGNGNPGCEDSASCFTTCEIPAGGLSGSSECERIGGVGGVPGKGTNVGVVGGIGVVGTPGGPGATCGGSSACDGTVGTEGAPGTPGSSGGGGAAIGVLAAGGYSPAAGGSGLAGTPGQGGGGGGGGGGGDDNCDSYGSSGGGGGGGGCGGSAGEGGGGAGGSFGVVLIDASVSISDSVVGAGTGGIGGEGGSGGGGGTGGDPGTGGPYGGSDDQDDGGDGAAGGSGGDGGRGGDGGGGGGGPAIGIACVGTSAVQLATTQVNGGTGGAGGAGGAPGGAPGTTGLSQAVLGCP